MLLKPKTLESQGVEDQSLFPLGCPPFHEWTLFTPIGVAQTILRARIGLWISLSLVTFFYFLLFNPGTLGRGTDPDELLFIALVPAVLNAFFVTWTGAQIFWEGPEARTFPEFPTFVARIGTCLSLFAFLSGLTLLTCIGYQQLALTLQFRSHWGLSYGELFLLYPLFRMSAFALHEALLEGSMPWTAVRNSWNLTRDFTPGQLFPFLLSVSSQVLAAGIIGAFFLIERFLTGSILLVLPHNSLPQLLLLIGAWISFLAIQILFLGTGLAWTAQYQHLKHGGRQ